MLPQPWLYSTYKVTLIFFQDNKDAKELLRKYFLSSRPLRFEDENRNKIKMNKGFNTFFIRDFLP